MTDKQIIEMLERNSIYSCEECCDYTTAWCEGDGCNVRIAKNALDLIKRQQEKIDLLEMDNERMTTKIFETAMNKAVADKVRAEAVKEFAEKLTDVYEGFDERHEQIMYGNLMKAIADVKKEMVGDSDA